MSYRTYFFEILQWDQLFTSKENAVEVAGPSMQNSPSPPPESSGSPQLMSQPKSQEPQPRLQSKLRPWQHSNPRKGKGKGKGKIGKKGRPKKSSKLLPKQRPRSQPPLQFQPQPQPQPQSQRQPQAQPQTQPQPQHQPQPQPQAHHSADSPSSMARPASDTLSGTPSEVIIIYCEQLSLSVDSWVYSLLFTCFKVILFAAPGLRLVCFILSVQPKITVTHHLPRDVDAILPPPPPPPHIARVMHGFTVTIVVG